MWLVRNCTRLRAPLQIINLEKNISRFSSEINENKSERKLVKDITKVCDKSQSIIVSLQSNERGYDSYGNEITNSLQNSNQNVEKLNIEILPEPESAELQYDDENFKSSGPLAECTEDLSHLGFSYVPSYNIAKYANKSRTIQEMVKLGVELYKIEHKKELMEFFLSRDFDRDMSPYIRFLCDCGVSADLLGRFITKNPLIFKEDLDDLHTRIRYLRLHQFDLDMIKTIMYKHPCWLSYKTSHIDNRLGHFQKNFKLKGHEVRHLAVTHPKLITYNRLVVEASTLSITGEMGFEPDETKKLLLSVPRLWTKSKSLTVATFDYAHSKMSLSHELIVQYPELLMCKQPRLQKRHEYLVHLNRAQYDPKKPLFVSPKMLVVGTDLDFCTNVAKTSLETYNLYLKTF